MREEGERERRERQADKDRARESERLTDGQTGRLEGDG